MEKGYIGKIGNGGSQNVKAPNQNLPQKKGKVQTGKDLRSK